VFLSMVSFSQRFASRSFLGCRKNVYGSCVPQRPAGRGHQRQQAHARARGGARSASWPGGGAAGACSRDSELAYLLRSLTHPPPPPPMTTTTATTSWVCLLRSWIKLLSSSSSSSSSLLSQGGRQPLYCLSELVRCLIVEREVTVTTPPSRGRRKK